MIRKKDGTWKSLLLILIFTVIMIIPFFLVGQLGVHSDWSFHAARVQQIYLNLKQGRLFTYIGTNTFSQIGSGNFLFYPYVFLYPWALLKFIFAPITAYLVYAWLILLATGLIAFFCMQSFSKGNTKQSLLFALIYLIAPYHLYLLFSNYVLGEAIAYTFIPIVLLGMYRLLYDKKWVMLAIGMTLMAYSHYVSMFISVEVCLLMLICYWVTNKEIRLKEFVDLAKAIVLFLLLSLWQFIPLITDYVHQDLVRPSSGFMLVQSAGDFVTSAINNDALNQGGIGILLLIALVFGWKLIEKNSKYMWAYVLGVLLTWMITSAFPWQYFAKTPLSIIQFPYRYTSFVIVFLAIVLSKILVQVKFSGINNDFIFGGLLLIFIFLYAGSIYSDIFRNKNSDGNVQVLTSVRRGKYKSLRDSTDSPIIITNQTYNKQFSYGALYGETDYMPGKAFENKNSILNRITYVDGKKTKLYQTGNANVINYYLSVDKKTLVDLPTLRYKNTVALVNNKKVSVESSTRNTVLVTVPRGKHIKISVLYSPSKLLVVTEIISALTWLVLVFYLVAVCKIKLGK